MSLTKDSFITPSVTILPNPNGLPHHSITPRQRIKAGHLVYIHYARASSNPLVNMPRRYGGPHRAFAKVLGSHPDDNNVLRVRIVFSFLRTSFAGMEYNISKRICEIVHPDPDFYGVRTTADTPHDERTDYVPVTPHNYGYLPYTLARRLDDIYRASREMLNSMARNNVETRIAEWDNLGIQTGHEAMVTRFLSSYGSYNKYAAAKTADAVTRLAAWKRGRKNRGKQLAGAIALIRREQTPAAFNTLHNLIQSFSTSGTLSTASKSKMIEIGNRIMEAHGFYRAGCGHYSTNAPVYISQGYSLQQLHDNYDEAETARLISRLSVCPDCLAARIDNERIVEAINHNGDSLAVDTHYASVYNWSDGTKRTYVEPPIIDGYHSSKAKLGDPLPHITGKKAGSHVLKVGYELEFVKQDGRRITADSVANKMLTRIHEATKGLLGQQPYACFERDGSVEFEMVSGYGPIDIHRAAILHVFGTGEFGQYVRSHDAGGSSCGLHVHLDKPGSFLHAVKMTRFWNDPDNKRLVMSIARRYSGGGYAKVVANKLKHPNDAAAMFRQAKCDYGNRRKRVISAAMTRINGDRYELLNWQGERTVEVRAFRGTLRASTIIACLEFSVMTWYFSRDTPAHLLNEDNFCKYISLPKWRHETMFLRKYLHGKGFNVWVPKVEPKAVIHADPVELINEA